MRERTISQDQQQLVEGERKTFTRSKWVTRGIKGEGKGCRKNIYNIFFQKRSSRELESSS